MKPPSLFSGQIKNCFDSHVHWRATGQFAKKLQLKTLRAEHDILQVIPKSENYFGEWLHGFGWDQNQFVENKFPSREILDQKFGDTPVYFVRIDGHAAWVNTAAMKKTDQWVKRDNDKCDGGKILLDKKGYPTGVFIDLAMMPFTKYFDRSNLRDIKSELLSGQKAFHRAGFTHIRDLTCDDLQWAAQCELAASGELHLAVEQFFSADDPADFADRLRLAKEAKKQKHSLLRPKGVKVYLDGALGSEGAWISKPYLSGSGTGLTLLEDNILLEMLEQCFANGIDLAVHTIGDESAHRVAQLALKIKNKGLNGYLHLEHAELLRPDTIEILQQLHVTCHLQPCHWLSDKLWLKEKIGDLSRHAFRWHMLEMANIPFDFGSDSPIEVTSVQRNFEAIQDADTNGIPKMTGDFKSRHSHPDANWCPQTYSVFASGRPTELVFCNKKIF